MRRFINLIQFNWKAFAISTSTILSLLILFSFFTEIGHFKNNFESQLAQYEIELEAKINKKDILGVQEILKDLKQPYIESILLDLPNVDFKLFKKISFGNQVKNSIFNQRFAVPIIANNLMIGTATYEINLFKALISSISQNIHFLIMMLVLSLMLLMLSNRKFFLGLENFKCTLEKVAKSGDLSLLHSENQKLSDDYAGVYKLALSNFFRSQTLADFGITLAHDIRSDLTALKFLLKEADQRPLKSSEMNTVLKLTGHIDHIANKLLKNKASPEKLKSAATPVLLHKVTQSISQTMVRQFQSNGTTLVVKNDLALNTFIKADEVRLFSHISNILKNSLEAKREMDSRITFSSFKDGEFVVFEIADNGRGIPSEALNKLGQNGFTTKQSGNGVGLYNAKSDVERWDGKFEIRSEVGIGTTISLMIPICPPPYTIPNHIDLTGVQ